jgi:putative acetyltransferase
MNEIQLKRTNSADPDFMGLVNKLDAELRLQYGVQMDTYDQHNIIEQNNTVVVAYLNNQPVGCGCFKQFDAEAVEVKRMFVDPSARGKHISRIVLTELEHWAHELGFKYTVLETGTKQLAAISLYQKSGYVLIPKYGPYVDMPYSVCYRKQL